MMGLSPYHEHIHIDGPVEASARDGNKHQALQAFISLAGKAQLMEPIRLSKSSPLKHSTNRVSENNYSVETL